MLYYWTYFYFHQKTFLMEHWLDAVCFFYIYKSQLLSISIIFFIFKRSDRSELEKKKYLRKTSYWDIKLSSLYIYWSYTQHKSGWLKENLENFNGSFYVCEGQNVTLLDRCSWIFSHLAFHPLHFLWIQLVTRNRKQKESTKLCCFISFIVIIHILYLSFKNL